MSGRRTAIDAAGGRSQNAEPVTVKLDTTTAVLGAAALAMGLLAGLFYAFSCAVLPGLADAQDRTLVDGMRNINDAIENPVFFLTFLGAPALAIWALVLARHEGATDVARWVIAGLVLCGVVWLVTFAFNFPLNDDLKNAGPLDRIADVGKLRDDFVGPWVAWNVVRTVACTAAFACLGWAVLLRARIGAAGPGPA
jgi:uncharacterized membrane protein